MWHGRIPDNSGVEDTDRNLCDGNAQYLISVYSEHTARCRYFVLIGSWVQDILECLASGVYNAKEYEHE